jgi:hypothetical protein
MEHIPRHLIVIPLLIVLTTGLHLGDAHAEGRTSRIQVSYIDQFENDGRISLVAIIDDTAAVVNPTYFDHAGVSARVTRSLSQNGQPEVYMEGMLMSGDVSADGWPANDRSGDRWIVNMSVKSFCLLTGLSAERIVAGPVVASAAVGGGVNISRVEHLWRSQSIELGQHSGVITGSSFAGRFSFGLGFRRSDHSAEVGLNFMGSTPLEDRLNAVGWGVYASFSYSL